MKIFHERFRNRKNRIGMYFVIGASVIFFLLLFDIPVPVLLPVIAVIMFILGIILFVIADKE